MGHRHVGGFWEAASPSEGVWWDQDFTGISPTPDTCAYPPCCTPLILFCDREGACSVVSNSLRPRGLEPTRLLCPRDSPAENTGVGCCILLPGIFPTQGSNLCLLPRTYQMGRKRLTPLGFLELVLGPLLCLEELVDALPLAGHGSGSRSGSFCSCGKGRLCLSLEKSAQSSHCCVNSELQAQLLLPKRPEVWATGLQGEPKGGIQKNKLRQLRT